MVADPLTLPIQERIRLVEDIWDSIAADQAVLPITDEQKQELDMRLESYRVDGNKGREVQDVISDIKKKL